jgi:hypothetical protein
VVEFKEETHKPLVSDSNTITAGLHYWWLYRNETKEKANKGA